MRARRGAGQPELFDLDLEPQLRAGGAASHRPPVGEAAEPLPLPVRAESERATAAAASQRAPFPVRAFAGATDLVVHLAVLALALGGARLLGVHGSAADLPALLVLLLVFSLVYTVVPLAFWGQTPGMAMAGVQARGAQGEPLSFGQAARRWLGALLLVASCGALALVGIGGDSVLDRLSGSRTRLI